MKKKILASFFSLILLFSISNGITANAESLDKTIEPTISPKIDLSTMSNTDSSIKFVDISKEELETKDIPEKEANVLDRQIADQNYELSQKPNTPGLNRTNEVADVTTTSNTEPNNAFLVTNDTVTQGIITTAGEMRWYAFILDAKSKVTIPLQMVATLDADLYLYHLNEETYQLELVGGSATSGLGVAEYFNNVLDAGIYYFAVGGYEGSGNFAFAYYESTKDVANEINDTAATATNATFGSPISGVIDNPNDIDYYKITVTTPTIIQYSISTTDNYSLLYAGKAGAEAAIYVVNDKSYKIMPGTYYFAVLSENGNYSSTSTYTVNFKKVGSLAPDSSLTKIGISENAGIIYQTNADGTVNYVNGNLVDISYSYYLTLSNSAGYQLYDISINPAVNPFALQAGEYTPRAVYYHSSTKPIMNVKSGPALLLTYYSDSNFYKINCLGTGAYSMNTFYQNLNFVTVLIDPATGKLIDIPYFNYYYDFAPVGTNSITITNSYTMDFYNN